eukprot:GGOE01011365.1.p4 GENE.GGOE01011365.1~~GGOE01011365.1.p4  ORF type:complete len:154 (+),score=3.06 GGOE01011365.1:246-707(+)
MCGGQARPSAGAAQHLQRASRTPRELQGTRRCKTPHLADPAMQSHHMIEERGKWWGQRETSRPMESPLGSGLAWVGRGQSSRPKGEDVSHRSGHIVWGSVRWIDDAETAAEDAAFAIHPGPSLRGTVRRSSGGCFGGGGPCSIGGGGTEGKAW